MNSFPLRIPTYKYALLLFLISFLIYGNGIQNRYALDDHLVNQENQLTQGGLEGIGKLFTSYSFKEKQYNYEFRPVLLLTFAIEYAVFGTNPHVSHCISILLFALFSLLLLLFLLKTFSDVPPLVIFLGIILFIVHPIHTEVIDNIKSRDELLVGVFGMGMLIQILNYFEDKKSYRIILAIVLAFAGFLTKQSFYIYVALVPVLYLMLSQKNKINYKQILFTLFCFLVVFVSIKFWQRAFLPKELYQRDFLFYENPLWNQSYFSRVPQGFANSLFYFFLLLWPFDFSCYYGYNQVETVTWLSYLPYLGVLFYAFLIYFATRFLKTNRFLSFSIFLLLINLLAISGVFILIPGIVGERFIFLGSVGFSIACALLIVRVAEKYKWILKTQSHWTINYKVILLFVALLLFQIPSVISRNKDWKDEFTLIKKDAATAVNSVKLQDLAALQYYKKAIALNTESPYRTELIQNAELCFLRCLQIDSTYKTCYNNLGALYFISNRVPESLKYYQLALQLEPGNIDILVNMATLYNKQNQVDSALKYYEGALRLNPDFPNLVPFYKQLLLKTNKQAHGIVTIKEIIRIFPSNYTLLLLITDLYNTQSDYLNAVLYLKQAYNLQPTPEILTLIGTLEKLIK